MLNFIATIEIEGKPEPREYNMNGRAGKSYKLNISQNDGRDTATVSCSEHVYNSVRRRDVVAAVFVYSENGDYKQLKIDSLSPFPDLDVAHSAAHTNSAVSGKPVSGNK